MAVKKGGKKDGAQSKKVQPRNGTTRVEEHQHHQDNVHNKNEDLVGEDGYNAQPPYRNYDKKAPGVSQNDGEYLNNDAYGENEDPAEQIRDDDYLNSEE